MIARPHDLLRIDPALASHWSAPTWVPRALARAPWVVVRRARSSDRAGAGAIAIGVRGASRGERFAACVRAVDVLAYRTPADLRASLGDSARPIDRAARALDAAARSHAIRWGPTGAYGFERASGVRTTHDGSDLDGILAVAPRETLATFARACARITLATGVRIDLEVQLRDVGVALDEYLGRAERVLAKTSAGPALVAR